jgi:metal-dependent amidase/aminoacylase/carboxypeptidase family protein
VVGCCEAAAQAAGCRVKFTSAGKDYQPYKPVYSFAEMFQRNLESLGETVNQGPVDRELGSTDVGNVSQAVPTIQPMIQICPREIACHMAAFADAAASDAGHRAMFAATKAMAMTALDLLTDPAALERVAAEFRGQASR